MPRFRLLAPALTPALSLSLSLALALWTLGVAPTQAQTRDPARIEEDAAAEADIDGFIRRAMDAVGAVPGLAVAVVDHDRIVLTAGYGVADVRTGRPVTARTAFYIASATKSFTALAFAAQAARGERDLTAPLSRAFSASPSPTSPLAADIADKVRLIDLLSHTSGLENGPLTFRAAYSGETAPDVMRAVAASTHWSAETPYGVFQYSNLGYNLATTLSGGDWRTLVQNEVLTPAGLRHTTAFLDQARQSGAVAVGHFGDQMQGPRVSPLQKTDATMHSAGGLVSTAEDMARWLELQINDGRIDGVQVFPQGLIASTHRSLAVQDRDFGAYHRDGYGLGWNLGTYGSERLVHHFGNFSGSRAHVSFMPERGLGVVVMVNEDLVAGELADVVADYAYDRLLGRPDQAEATGRALSDLVATRDRRRAALARAKEERAARPWRLTRPMTALEGDYRNAEMGTIEVRRVGDGLTIRLGDLSADAEPFTTPDVVRVELIPFQGQTIRFEEDGALTFEGLRFQRR